MDPIVSALLGIRQQPVDDPVAGLIYPGAAPKVGQQVPQMAAPNLPQVASGVGELTGVNDAVKALRGQMTPEEAQTFALGAVPMLVGGPEAKAAEELAPPLYSAAAKAIQEAKLTKGTPEQWLGYLRNQPGVKQEELGYMGALPKTDTGQLSKDEMNQWAQTHQVQLKDVTKDDSSQDGMTIGMRMADEPKFGRYQLPGGQNYREMLMTLPQKQTSIDESLQQRGGPAQFTSSHWDEPNVLAHARMNDRVVPDAQGTPQKTLFLEELQSDWHQKGRQIGYKRDLTDAEQAQLDQLGTARRQAGLTAGPEAAQRYTDLIAQEDRLRGRDAVPDAPFKSTWPDLMLKRLVRHAAEGGYDQLAWTPGDVQADRYDLSKQISMLHAYKNENGTFDIAADPVGRMGTMPFHDIGKNIAPEKLADYVGKDLADKISQQTVPMKQYEGSDLKVGGEGMRAFYDKMLVDKANAIGKRYGARVTQAPLTTEGTASFRPMNDIDFMAFNGAEPGSHIRDVNGVTQIRDPEGNVREIRADPDDNLTEHDLGKIKDEAVSHKVHVLPITPELKRAALTKGFPMFAAGGLAAGLSSGSDTASEPPPNINEQMLQALRGQGM